MGNVADYVGSCTAGAAADQYHANGNGWGQLEQVNQDIGYQGHNGKLQQGADGHAFGPGQHCLKVAGGQAHAHTEHDNAQEQGNPGSQRLQQSRLYNAQDPNEDNASGHITGTKMNEFIQHRGPPSGLS